MAVLTPTIGADGRSNAAEGNAGQPAPVTDRMAPINNAKASAAVSDNMTRYPAGATRYDSQRGRVIATLELVPK
jgi:hypothetical protein